MVAGPGAAYICDECLELCREIINDPAPFSPKALELAARPPVVIPAPPEQPGEQQGAAHRASREPLRSRAIELEQRQPGGTLMLRQMEFYQQHFELHYLWMRAPLSPGFAFVPRLIFLLRDSTGFEWAGDRGGLLFERAELSSDPNLAVYQGSARFRPLPSDDAHRLVVRAADPLGQFETPPLLPWEFEITL
jgi:ClpX C4-type zinc finger